jgi:O-methyltransferase involved in polyketide biosynthesis
MSSIDLIKTEVAAAVARGVRQCVVLGSRSALPESFESSPEQSLQVFAPAQLASEALAATLEKSDFDKLKASLFVWIGGAGFRTVDAVIAALAFIGSLPRGSAVVFDYSVERTSIESRTHTALDALASRISLPGSVKYLIQPRALAALLRGLGFNQIVDLAQEELPLNGIRLVSAVV